jgi:prephenate dehydrogenase
MNRRDKAARTPTACGEHCAFKENFGKIIARDIVIAGFNGILIIGVGLIGGSLAGALKTRDAGLKVVGVDADPFTVKTALDLGIIDEGKVCGGPVQGAVGETDESVSLESILSGEEIDLVILATPVNTYPEWFRFLARSDYAGVVTDVGSTKQAVVAYAREALPRIGCFVPGHPMAGSEAGGISAANAELFDGAYWILTPCDRTDAHVFRRLHTLLTAIGARVISVDPAEHDRVIAIVSHVPHIAAASLVALAGHHAGKDGDLLRFAAGGFKDTTRVAAGNPDLWTGILLDNADIVADALREFTQILSSAEDMLRSKNREGLYETLKAAAAARKALPAKWIPESSQLIEVRIPMGNRPGIVAEITAVAGRAGCNIQAIEIDHQTEERAVLTLTLTDEGHIDDFITTLQTAGFKPYRG